VAAIQEAKEPAGLELAASGMGNHEAGAAKRAEQTV